MTTALITGGAGFIGSHIVADLQKHTDWDLVLIDRLDCSGNLNRLAEIGIDPKRVRFVFHDLKGAISGQLGAQIGAVDYILHLAAGTHVDRSIEDPMSFVMDNVVATCNLLEYARRTDAERFLYFSTDEVFGPAPEGVRYKEWDRYKSGNPYAATKAGAEELVGAYHNTYGLPTLVTHTMNVFGPMQHPEKFIPSTIRKVRDGETVTIHSNKDRTKAGSRYYIHADHVADAVRFVLDKGEPGDKYNIVGQVEMDNLELAQMIAAIQDKPLHYEMVDFHSQRPGHDLRYALDGSKLEEMGWTPPDSFTDSMRQTVEWTMANAGRWL
jgi:dTDP-glucose 4,6-dehydratase